MEIGALERFSRRGGGGVGATEVKEGIKGVEAVRGSYLGKERERERQTIKAPLVG